MKNTRILRRKKLAKLENKRIKRNSERKRLRIANKLDSNLTTHKRKSRIGL